MKKLSLCLCLCLTYGNWCSAQRPTYPTSAKAVRQDGIPAGKLLRGSFNDSAIYPAQRESQHRGRHRGHGRVAAFAIEAPIVLGMFRLFEISKLTV